jgi:DNA-binding NtrC family response regulator
VDDVARGDTARERLLDPNHAPYDAIISDLRLPGCDGLAVLAAALERSGSTAGLLMTAFGSVEAAVQAMRLGAADFVQKPFELDELEARLDRALEHARLLGEVAQLRRERGDLQGRERIVGSSPSLQQAVSLAERVARTDSTVLVTGETGTGKELIAGLIHRASGRRDGAFVKVNCAALPETLLESELFGHERGAFTSADRTRIGRFEQADGGTLFLDEIGDMSPATQAKLLRVLQGGEFHRLGGTRVIRSDARVVAATHRDLQRAIASGEFRQDLFFRLNVIAIPLPPLRERGADVEELAHHLLGELAAEWGRPEMSISDAARGRLRGHSWPGNVRELRNVIERALLLSEGSRIEEADLHFAEGLGATEGWRPELPSAGLALEEIQRAAILEALERTGWVQKEAAALLRVSRRKLNYMIQRMGIRHASWRRNREVEG